MSSGLGVAHTQIKARDNLICRKGRDPAARRYHGGGKRETSARSILVPDITPSPGTPEAMARASIEAAISMPLLEVFARYALVAPCGTAHELYGSASNNSCIDMNCSHGKLHCLPTFAWKVPLSLQL